MTHTINYFYSGYNVILETDGNGNVIASYQSACCIINGVKYYPIRDIRSSIIALTDTNGNITAQYDYDAYGKLLWYSNPSIDNRYLFCGCQFDEERRLYCMGHRFYDPDIGRFITPDPIGIAGGQLNLYAYCCNDPVNLTDKKGLAIYSTTPISGIYPDIDNNGLLEWIMPDKLRAYEIEIEVGEDGKPIIVSSNPQGAKTNFFKDNNIHHVWDVDEDGLIDEVYFNDGEYKVRLNDDFFDTRLDFGDRRPGNFGKTIPNPFKQLPQDILGLAKKLKDQNRNNCQ